MTWLHWALLSAFFAALTAVLTKVGVAHVDSNVATAIRTAVILIASILFAARSYTAGALQQIDTKGWTFLVLSGVATALSWLCYFRALQLGDAAQVAPVDKISVVITVILAVVFLRERVTTSQCLGLILIVMGVVLVARR